MTRLLERALADPDHRLEHDREHGGLQAEEECFDDPDLPEGGVAFGRRAAGDRERTPGSTKSVPATSLPLVLCSSQPT